MNKLLSALKANQAMTFISLAGGTAVIFAIALIGLAVVKKSPSHNTKVAAGPTTTTTAEAGAPSTVAGGTATTAASAAQPGAAPRTATTAKPATGTATPGHTTVNTLPSSAGATRIGVSSATIKWGLHAPKTLQGVPWGLADDALK